MTRPTRVLFLDHTARLGGGEIALANLVAELARGGEVRPRALLFEDGPLVGRLREAGCPAEVVPLGGLGEARKDAVGGVGMLLRLPAAVGFARRLARRIKADGADLVYCNSLKSDVLGGLAARLAGVPCVWHVRDRVESDYLPRRVVPVFRRLCRLVPHGVAANSEHTMATLRLPASKVRRVLYSGVVPPIDPPAEPPGPPVVGIVGRLAPWKGQHVFLDAMALVRREVPEARFRLVGSALFGENDYEASLRRRAAEADLAGGVEFAGFEADVWAALAAMAVVVHASTTPEPFGQVVVEAMAAGRPVVATDAGGVRETVVNGVTGLLVPTGDAPATAAAVTRLLRDPALRRRLAAAGRDRAVGRFHVSRTAGECLALIDEVISRRGGPTR